MSASAVRQARQPQPPSAAAAAAASDHAETAAEAPAEAPAEVPARKRAGKRKVAMFVGYEGTEYRGLQRQAQSAPEATIEDCLEEAVFRAGGILPSNRGDLGKVGWSRSSRTDKSVHSLATVVGLKMEVAVEAFESDPEGQQLAAAINAHLPPEVRVFSIQRVSKSWNARSECIRRSYNYYLPASVLGLRLDGGDADRQRLALLAAAWERFQGNHPFHNYTKRRLYREKEGARRPRRGSRDEEEEEEEGEEASPSDASDSEGSGSPAGSSSGGGSSSAATAAAAAAAGALAAAEGASSGSLAGGGSNGGAEEEQEQRRGLIRLEWKHERDDRDPVVRRHFRFIEWCRVDPEIRTLVPGGEPCVQLSLQGGSFMLHQIRKMVAVAVAVARGALPPQLQEASLATPARMNLPLAPPSTLMLVGAQFSPFKRSYSGEVAAAAQWTGEVLELRAAGAAAQQRFLRDTMLPALDGLLAGEEWEQWAADLDRISVDPAQLESFLGAYREWRERRAANKAAARTAALLQEAAALEQRDDA